MRKARRAQPELEGVESRVLQSVFTRLGVGSLAPIVAAKSTRTVHLSGSAQGTWHTLPSIPDVGKTTKLDGSGAVAPFGPVTVTGTFQSPGFIAHGRARGTVTLFANGSQVVLQLTGPIQPGFSDLPQTFTYKIASASHRFAGDVGTGTVRLTLVPAQYPNTPAGQIGPHFIVAPRFTLTFLPNSH